MISIELYGYIDRSNLVKLGEQFFLEPDITDLDQCLSILCGTTIYKWMLQECKIKFEIEGYDLDFREQLLRSILQVESIEIYSNLRKKSFNKLLQLYIDSGCELQKDAHIKPLKSLQAIAWPHLVKTIT